MTRHIILFMAANPADTDRLALDSEARNIQIELESGGLRDRFRFVTWWATQPLDLLRQLRELEPTVVHFSGHGGPQPPGKDPRAKLGRDAAAEPGMLENGQEHGLFFQGPGGGAQFVSADALAQTFAAAGASVKLVVLNACYSETQAAALATHVDCVVGMSGAIRDGAARSFAIGLYGGLGAGESVAAAFEQGRAVISLEGHSDCDRPKLRVRPGVDATQFVLDDPAPRRRRMWMAGPVAVMVAGLACPDTPRQVPDLPGDHPPSHPEFQVVASTQVQSTYIACADQLPIQCPPLGEPNFPEVHIFACAEHAGYACCLTTEEAGQCLIHIDQDPCVAANRCSLLPE